MTQAGVILGTAAYMAPEQAKGNTVDRRADIWAFGVVLFEMLTGRQLFSAKTTAETLAAVLTSEIDCSQIPDTIPPAVRRLLKACLHKDPKRRLRDIGDAWRDLDDPPSTSTAPAPRSSRFAWTVAAIAPLLVLAGSWLWLQPPTPPSAPVTRWTTMIPDTPTHPWVALSHDGTRLAWRSGADTNHKIMLRAIDQFEGKPIPGAGNVSVGLLFSPDAQWIFYTIYHPGNILKVPTQGGEPITVCEGSLAYGGAWDADGNLLFSSSKGIMRVSAAGGNPEVLIPLDSAKGDLAYVWPEVLPGGRAILFASNNAILSYNLETREKRELLKNGSRPRYVRSGHIVFARNNVLLAIPFDLSSLQTRGDAVPIITGVSGDGGAGFFDYSVADTGLLVYVSGSRTGRSNLVWADRHGVVTPAIPTTRSYVHLHLSPEGQRAALAIETDRVRDIWMHGLQRGTLTRLTFDEHADGPLWTPDGKNIAYRRSHVGGWEIRLIDSEGTRPPKTLWRTANIVAPSSWALDGKALLFAEDNLQRPWDIFMLSGLDRPAEERRVMPLIGSPFREASPRVSPDGEWLAYHSDESGRPEVYVQKFPGLGGKLQISTAGGSAPHWTRGGRELLYIRDDQMISVDIQTAPQFHAGMPKALFKGAFANNTWDVTPDGQRFLMIVPDKEQDAAPRELHVVTNWFEELKRRAPPHQ
jgi:serine/threonine-protein kinase